MLRHVLLGLLARQPRHGYDLKHLVEQTLGSNWEINFGQIYTTLGRLERDGLVTSQVDTEDARGKRTYTIAEAGQTELEAWLNQAVEKKEPFRDEFLVRLIVRTLAGCGDAMESIARQRQTYLQQLRDLTALAARAEEQPYVALLAEGVILHLQADLRWVDLCEERLEKLSLLE